MAFSSGVMLLVLVLFGAQAFLPQTISPLLVFLVSLSDLLFLKILETASQAFMAVQLLGMTAQLNVWLSVTRLLAALSLITFFPKPGTTLWACLYLLSTAVSALVAVLLVHRMLGHPKLAIWRLKTEVAQGFYFSVGLSSQSVYNDIDKTMLARLSTLEATGIYAAAYRLIDVSFVPMRSLVFATYPNFFKYGATGVSGSASFAKRLLPIGIACGIAAGAGLFFLAPVVPYFLGDEYVNAVEAVRWLSPLPLLKGIHLLGANTLTGADLQQFRCTTELTIALFNVLVNLWVIPLYSWKGAAWSSIASDSLLMLSMWVIVWFQCWKKRD
jgi:O-antigen/teichoic acid export membrane protein